MKTDRAGQPRATPAVRSPTSEMRRTLDALRRIVQALRIGARDGESRTGLSSAQLFALQQVADHPGASINDVAALTFTHQSSVSVVIQRLVARRFVAKVAAPHDRRRQHLELTPAGARVLRRAPAVVQERLIAAIALLPADDRRTLARTLSEVARLVTPKDAAPYPPMLFEEEAGSGSRGAKASRRRVGRPKPLD